MQHQSYSSQLPNLDNVVIQQRTSKTSTQYSGWPVLLFHRWRKVKWGSRILMMIFWTRAFVRHLYQKLGTSSSPHSVLAGDWSSTMHFFDLRLCQGMIVWSYKKESLWSSISETAGAALFFPCEMIFLLFLCRTWLKCCHYLWLTIEDAIFSLPRLQFCSWKLKRCIFWHHGDCSMRNKVD